MGLFSKLFNSKKVAVFTSETLGEFKLVHSNGNENLWHNASSKPSLTVKGTDDSPDVEHLRFLETANEEIEYLNKKITGFFIEEFQNADMPVDFTDWRQRFEIISIEVMQILNSETYWRITFEEKETFAHFNLFIEGKKLIDFSIDT